MKVTILTGILPGPLRERMSDSRIYHILTPHLLMFRLLLRITLILFGACLLSINRLVTMVMIPGYVVIFVLFYNFWQVTAQHGYRLLPVIFSVVLINVPFFIAAHFIRTWIISLF